MATIINSFALSGVNGYLVEVETKAISGKPSVTVVGLGDTVKQFIKGFLKGIVIKLWQ